MRMRSWWVLVVASMASGCANYHAVSDFAAATSDMTGVVKSEFVELDTLCVQQVETVIVVNNLGTDRALDQCDRYQRSQARFAAVTVDVLDRYASALTGLANDKTFDLSPDIKAVGSKARAFKATSFSPPISDAEVTAVTRIADLLVTVLAAEKRDDAVKQMLAAAPDLEVMGRSLKTFFVGSPTVPNIKPAYANFVDLITASTTSTLAALDSKPMRKAEPIRTAELARDLRARQRLLDRRAPSAPDSVPIKIAADIDAWLAALDRFEVDGMKADAREVADRLQTLREATSAAKEAVATH